MNTSSNEIEATLEQLDDLPATVAAWQVETGRDATDDPAVWVWAWLEDGDIDRSTRSLLRNIIRDAVRRKVHEHENVLVYTRFPLVSEMEPVA